MAADHLIGIIGAGFGGIATALRLQREGMQDFIIFERAGEIGGTWRDNTYPGCACDVKSALYSLADAPNPNWEKLFAGQEEIWQYMKDVVQQRGLNQHIRFNTDIVEACFSEERGCWLIKDSNGITVSVRFLIAGLGSLNRIRMADIPGEFKGKTMHSAAWDKQFDIRGKRVAVIGTGASAVQIVPSIAPIVDQLYVFQRTAAWVINRHNGTVPGFMKRLHKALPFTLTLRREFQYWLNEFLGNAFTGNRMMNEIARKLALRKLRNEVHDPELRKRLTPDYTIGCKRVLRSDDYLPAFNRPNVHLVTESIGSLYGRGIETKKGERYPVDVVIYCTGFHVTDFNYPIRICCGGKELFETLRTSGGAAYKGTVVTGFPNFFMLMGPNTGLGHNSVVHIMESQLNYILPFIKHTMKSGEKAYASVLGRVQAQYFEKIQEQLKKTVWASGCKSWYLDEQGHNPTLYPKLNTHFRRNLRSFHSEDLLVSIPD